MQAAGEQPATKSKPKKTFLDCKCERTGERIVVKVRADRNELVSIEANGKMLCNCKVQWVANNQESCIDMMKQIAESYIQGRQ